MKVNDFFIPGLLEILPDFHSDFRGVFFESYRKDFFEELGIKKDFVQDNQSLSKKNVLRGLHFQKSSVQAKLVRAVSGRILDVAVDLRCGSSSFGKHVSVVLDSEKGNMLYIPEGFAHGFLALTDNCIQLYKCTDFYRPGSEGGLLWKDPKLSISWSEWGNPDDFILSEKDKVHPLFDEHKKYFDKDGKWIQPLES